MTPPLVSGRFVTAMVVLAAIVSLPLLPPQHLHRAGIEGRTEPLVHAHLAVRSDPTPDLAGASAPGVSHGDHRLAVFANGDYTAPEIIAGPAAPPPAAVIVLPVPVAQSAVSRSDPLRIHGPPRLVPAGRAPPIPA